MDTEQPFSALAGNAGFLLSRCGAAVQAGFKELLAQWQLRPQQFAILTTLNRAGEASQQELCQALRIDSGNMVELVDKLETLGYAQRRRDPRDRRRYRLGLTEPGQAAFAEMTAAMGDYNDQFFAPLSPAELATLVTALGKLFATTPEGTR